MSSDNGGCKLWQSVSEDLPGNSVKGFPSKFSAQEPVNPNSPLTLALTPLPRVSAGQPKGQDKVVKISLPRPSAWCLNYKRWGQKLVDATVSEA